MSEHRSSISSSVRALRHRPYRRWMAAGLVSVSGTWMQQVAQSWLVYARSGSGAAVGLTIALQAAPTLLFGLWGGGLVDRLDRRSLLMATQLANALLAAGLAAVVMTDGGSVHVIQAFGLAAGLVAVFDGPASGAYGASLLPPEDLSNGLALGSLVSSTGRVAGLALAGAVVATVGPSVAFATNAASFLVPLAILWRSPSAPPPSGPIGERARLSDGVRHVWASSEARVTLSTAWVLSCVGRSFQVTMALMAAQAFGHGAGLYGRFSTLFGVGAMTGSLLATRLPWMTRRVLVYAGAGAAVLQVASGLVGSAATFGLLMVPIAGCAVVLDTATSTRLQLSTDPAMRGRVLAIAGIVGVTAGMIGAPLLGWLGEQLGARAPLVFGGTIATITVACYVHLRVGRPDPTAVPAPVPSTTTGPAMLPTTTSATVRSTAA